MNYEQIHSLFKQRYNQGSWKQFLSEAFVNTRLLASPEILVGVDTNVASQVKKLGFITLDVNGIERHIAVYEVTLAEGIILERNRIGLRNLLRKYWKDIDAAFIVYFRPGIPNWRFTYVSELTGFNVAGDFVKIKTEPKRYTYILGEGESTRTAAERFAAIARKGIETTLDDVKEAFSVEKLSKSFFDEYKKHYDIFCDFMVSKPSILQSIFNGNKKGIRDFNKKFLGRIVFLYFIQKKGWLGVPLKEDWGNGDFNFLTKQFENFRNKDLFYKDFLSILFFETLNTKRKDDIFNFDNAQFILKNTSLVKIPFLSGGLFDEDDKLQRRIIFPPNLIKSLFDFFNQYNFTIYEDSPNDHTVAVDPEMLGHIFENLLEDNKDKGAFYTPKEIVHYMCQESLIEYLCTALEIEDEHKEKEAITLLLKKKEFDPILQSEIKNLNKSLDNVKICDPAIGSGAFPMGLLHEIFTAKQTLHTFEYGNTKTFDSSAVKLNIIQNSIYGVDIEKGAVDIARLRFWLSLIVDENKPQALPNLDYKIVVGNSLVTKLGDDIIDINWSLNETSHGLFGADLAKQKSDLLNKICEEQKEFFKPNSNKKKLAMDIRNSKIDLLITQLELMVKTQGIETKPTGTNRSLAKQTEIYLQTISWKNSIKNLQKQKNKTDFSLQFFDWKLDFPEIMNEEVALKLGFDIVIGNPPYVDYRKIDNTTKIGTSSYFVSKHSRMINLYNYFIERSFYLTRSNGCVALITPQQYLILDNCKGVRDFIRQFFVIKLADFARVKLFQAATYTFVSIFRKSNSLSSLPGVYNEFESLLKLDVPTKKININNPLDEPFSSSIHLLLINKIESLNKKMLGDYINVFCGSSSNNNISDLNREGYFNFLQASDIFEYELKLKESYVKKSDYSNNSFKNQMQTVIYTSRMTNRIRACIVENNKNILGGKVNVLFSTSENLSNYFLLALLNSNLINFWYREKFNIQHMQGGALPINTSDIEKIPLPIIKDNHNLIIETAKLIMIKKRNGDNILELLQYQNSLIYKLYDLSYSDVIEVEPDFYMNKDDYKSVVL
jgi:adenine-specific DNA-methyltransferase